MRLIDADKLKQDHFMGDECETCINDAGRCQNWHVYTKMDFCEWIDDAPTVDPVKHGQWINISIYADGIVSSAECDLCGAIVHNNFSSIINYCPNCGAYMGGVEDDKRGVE